MAYKRNRVLELKEYLESLGINVNLGKNKARGHKGVFMHNFSSFRIDVARNIKDEEQVLSTLLHEFAHFIHYSYDKKLTSLDFAFGSISDEIKEELIKITVQDVPKDFASSLFQKKETINNEMQSFLLQLKQYIPNFKLSERNLSIEKNLSRPLKYLLSYDSIKYFNKLFSIKNLDEYNLKKEEKLYILIKSKQRMLKRINSKINRLNKYYNNPSELFARFIDSYYTKPDFTKITAPIACKSLTISEIPMLKDLDNILIQ